MPSRNSFPASSGERVRTPSPAPLSVMLRRSLLATAVTLATLLSAAAVHGADGRMPVAGVAAAAKREPAKAAPTPAVSVAISGNGAVYLLRNGATLQFWLVSLFGTEVNLGNVRLEELGFLEALRSGSHPVHGFGQAGDYPWIRAVETKSPPIIPGGPRPCGLDGIQPAALADRSRRRA